MVTERLYYTDSALLEFTASVLDIKPAGEVYHVVLDRTGFYPTGGGQPNDTGRLDDSRVIDVIDDDEDGRVLHVVSSLGSLAIGNQVTGTIDAARRIDHLQQHSGQHILSQAFVQACGAETRSFHLGGQTSTIDIELANPTADHMHAAEDVANSVIFDDRPMRVHLVSEEEAARLPLRKESAVRGTIRVIEVQDFDWSPCGGTHAARAGQVGLVAIKSFERAKKMTRVEFACGHRALVDYRIANQTATAVARLFSTERDSGPQSVDRLIQENKSLKRRVRELLEIALVGEAEQLLAGAARCSMPGLVPDSPEGPAVFRVVRARFDGRDPEELRLLAHKVIERGRAVALLGTSEGTTAKVVFARSADLELGRSPEVSLNMGVLLTEACQMLGGRGGGKAEMAQ
ncbi:MAG TPA: alanine--tRNA ligase-related protein, partial [Blastocatellia bacterium]|nr:alanine--tRNA ligase-related protein [Blastocatellia bacterium]